MKNALNRSNPLVTMYRGTEEIDVAWSWCCENRKTENKILVRCYLQFLFFIDLRSQIPIVSRIECIDNCGIPISIARIPVEELINGPIVDP